MIQNQDADAVADGLELEVQGRRVLRDIEGISMVSPSKTEVNDGLSIVTHNSPQGCHSLPGPIESLKLGTPGAQVPVVGPKNGGGWGTTSERPSPLMIPNPSPIRLDRMHSISGHLYRHSKCGLRKRKQ